MAQDKMAQRLKLDRKTQVTKGMDSFDEKMFRLQRVAVRNILSESSNERREKFYETVKHLDGSVYEDFKVMQKELLGTGY
jgi:hypothetical protein